MKDLISYLEGLCDGVHFVTDIIKTNYSEEDEDNDTVQIEVGKTKLSEESLQKLKEVLKELKEKGE